MKETTVNKKVGSLCIWLIIFSLLTYPTEGFAYNTKPENEKKIALFRSIESLTGLPWEYLAAMDQYEQNIQKKDTKPLPSRITSIQILDSKWSGLSNPDLHSSNPTSIHFFQGMGRDGDGDGIVDSENDQDVLYSVAIFLSSSGNSEDQIREQLWKYYQQPSAVDVITHIARLYQKHQTLLLDASSFPIPLQYNYTYRGTWGANRGWGGRRIHEGTDIFAGYGTPVLSTCYGYVELVGWNVFGGWRIGIRDAKNQYHYFAHLKGFRKGLKKGDLVTPGEVLGAVGSSGYGPPGTSGKFPPHLHYGVYKFNGSRNYSFDPFPLLKKWEKEARIKKKSTQKKKKH
ncbi:Murein DD-endopeptidase MepM and murein hydrolase activator NlpD, contain LysM domain [Thermoactinomyces sp. DSM 45891]|uniref:M23 family metallopeptidase n=1 Tax=Thermoactinomyces sp. DSM 45891 TaxID=1761907 RepID=UPI0009169B05|nr:M23 family metallopeptidase [Thermoactinomyces sp. DSM 45891]SFX42077.1 Murein DD-endopeptidase MepM and murein hydrolase activator NlpD, contain LysM domain [Thermoactinomyces sp. DSM 45891]